MREEAQTKAAPSLGRRRGPDADRPDSQCMHLLDSKRQVVFFAITSPTNMLAFVKFSLAPPQLRADQDQNPHLEGAAPALVQLLGHGC